MDVVQERLAHELERLRSPLKRIIKPSKYPVEFLF
jgi:hypothetical protein